METRCVVNKPIPLNDLYCAETPSQCPFHLAIGRHAEEPTASAESAHPVLRQFHLTIFRRAEKPTASVGKRNNIKWDIPLNDFHGGENPTASNEKRKNR